MPGKPDHDPLGNGFRLSEEELLLRRSVGKYRQDNLSTSKVILMIHPRTMLDFLTAEPFLPFRIHMASGAIFDVRHPEMVRVGKSSVTVHKHPEGDEEQPSRWQEVSLMLMESLEPIANTISQGQK